VPRGRWQLHSELPVGKGMASSTADIVATLRCLYNVFELPYEQSVVTEILREIERTDTVFLDEFALYLSAHHRVVASLGDRIGLHTCYVVEDAVVDTDGVTDELLRDYRSRAGRYRRCLSELLDAFRRNDAHGVARGATASARLSQDVVPKESFDDVVANQSALGADGVFVAHTGSVIGYLFRAQPGRTQMDELSAFFRSLGSQCAFARAGWGHA
jgi:L-threonine kinase